MMSVFFCLSSCEHIPGTTCPVLTKLFICVTDGRRSVLLWRRCLCYGPVLWVVSYLNIMGQWGICISTGAAAASDVTASSCAGYSAATVSYWLRRVLQSDGRPQARSGDLPAPQSSKQEGGGAKRVLGGTRQASNPRRRKRRTRDAESVEFEVPMIETQN